MTTTDQKLRSNLSIDGINKPISALALGTAFYNPESKDECFGIMDSYLDLGGTVVDTGRQYGESEEVVGQWLEKSAARDRMVVITKCAHGPGLLPADGFEEVVTQELAESLMHLRTDYVDLYVLHRDNPSVPVGRILDRLNAEIDGGRVVALGASNWSYARAEEANEYARQHGMRGFAVVSNNLSLAVPEGPFYPGLVSADQDGERWHQNTSIPLLSWSSQARGFFTGRYTPDMRDKVGSIDDKFTKRMVEIYCTDANFERLKRANQLANEKQDYTAVQIALAWLLHKPFPVIPIVGPHTPEELVSCADATGIKLTEAETKWLQLDV